MFSWEIESKLLWSIPIYNHLSCGLHGKLLRTMKSSLSIYLALATGVLGMVITLLFVGDMIFSISNFRIFGQQKQSSTFPVEEQLRQAGITTKYSNTSECKPRIKGLVLTLCSNRNLRANPDLHQQ